MNEVEVTEFVVFDPSTDDVHQFSTSRKLSIFFLGRSINEYSVYYRIKFVGVDRAMLFPVYLGDCGGSVTNIENKAQEVKINADQEIC